MFAKSFLNFSLIRQVILTFLCLCISCLLWVGAALLVEVIDWIEWNMLLTVGSEAMESMQALRKKNL